MTRLRVGLDMTSIPEVRDALTTFGHRYTQRIFTTEELKDTDRTSTGDMAGLAVRAQRLAARFAAKEAAIKVLAPDADIPVWRDIELRSRSGGALELRWHGTAARLAADAGVEDVAVSITHEGEYAAAVVVAWCAPQEER